MAYDHFQGMIVVSKPSNSSLVPAFGLAKVQHRVWFVLSSYKVHVTVMLLQLSIVDLRHNEYVGVHSGVIRDVAFSPRGDSMLLTASMDKSVRLTSMLSNAVVQRSVSGSCVHV